MDLILLFMLSLCCWTGPGRATRYVWTDKPKVILSSDEITDGESMEVSCTLPVDYRGGECRLYRGSSDVPFTVMIAVDYICVFHLSSKKLLGKRPVGSEISLRCDYKIQDYTSRSSDRRSVVVWGTRPSPSLSISRHFLSPDDSIELTCSPPVADVATCQFYKNQYFFTEGPCSRNMTGREFAIWEKPTLLLPLNLTCTYDPYVHRYIRSEHSNHQLLFVVDASRVTSSVTCEVSVSDDQLKVLEVSRWMTGGANETNVTVQVTNSSLTLHQTCN